MAFFVIEQTIIGGRNRKTVTYTFIKKFKNLINRHRPSPYRPKGIIYSIEKWFENGLQPQMKGSWIKIIVPENKIYREKAKNIYGRLDPPLDKWHGYHSYPAAYLCLLKNANVVNENGVVISYDNKVYSDFTYQIGKPIEKNDVFISYIRKPEYIEGCFATIASSESSGYFHWMLECLPRIKLIEDYIDDIDFLIVPDGLKKFHIETLDLLGFPEEKLYRIKNSMNIQCENLFVPSLPIRDALMSTWVCEFLRESFIPENAADPHRLIYISRKDALYRKIENEEEVEGYLKEKGFEILQMSKLPFTEQVRACAEAKIVIGPHGAGLTNIVFCRNAKILELFSPSYLGGFSILANHGKNEYWYLVGDDIPGNSPPSWKNFRIDIKELDLTLNSMLKE
ncbi:Capsular polysaccharide biosynthesis protein [Methanosalsum zhilinae DSM 4017]|uniref:Capsular polysaccharide biosynthesis protein n=1 Tax=Methanosalsum zhilinae (strain DSM 4017 / NBRC 107636 / OCM 62 / WeN5) TaxID=679901 RepID=F7XPW0_METZD|nr:glycosyltransferase family 61 protein [Methanosalsum zhilinae]AEH61481.1 Capsular polysaccharide biosynthesis protein [Methanosalsum zhilinae DSM 4017]